MAEAMTRPGDMLFGRRTWQDFTAAWGRRTDGNPVTARMNATTKYVVSRTLKDADAWQNSVLLRGDAAGTVAELKAQPGGDVGIIGSVSLVRSLHAAGLTDRYTLLICPLTLGSGAWLERAGQGSWRPRNPARESRSAGAAVVMATPARVASGASGAGSTPP